jgi:hypothetical protein
MVLLIEKSEIRERSCQLAVTKKLTVDSWQLTVFILNFGANSQLSTVNRQLFKLILQFIIQGSEY